MDRPPTCCTEHATLTCCARDLYRWEIEGHGYLPADWSGWRLAGKFLISPEGDRITPRRLRGILFGEVCRKTLRPREQRVLQGQVISRGFTEKLASLKRPTRE